VYVKDIMDMTKTYIVVEGNAIT